MRYPRIFLSLVLSATCIAATSPAVALPLASSGQLTLPANCVPANSTSGGCGPTTQPVTAFGAIQPTINTPTALSFTGTWSTGVAPAWVGTFTGSGPYPSGTTGASTSTWDFSGLGPNPGAGFLPTGTFVGLGDLDSFGAGGGSERFEIIATDSNGIVIRAPWLDDVFFVSSLNCAIECVQAAMPEYQWDATTGTYTFDGDNVTALNPTLTAWVTTNMDIYGLVVNKSNLNFGLALAAPAEAVPEPGSLLLVGLGLAGLLTMRRRGNAG